MARNAVPDSQPAFHQGVSDDDASTPLGPRLDIADVVGILARGWIWIVLGLGLGLGLAFVVSQLVPATYKATARILIDNSITRYLYSNRLGEEPTLEGQAHTQIYVVTSERVLSSVVRALDLTQDPDFSDPTLVPRTAIAKAVTTMFKGTSDVPQEDPRRPRPHTAEQVAMDILLRQLEVYRTDVPNVMDITVASRDPDKAASIANAVADSYLAFVSEAKVDSGRLASRLMQERLQDVKARLSESERALQQFKLANRLVAGGKTPLTTDQLANLNSHLTTARVTMAEAKARLERAQSGQGDLSRNLLAPDNDIILKLRAQYLEYGTRLKETEGRVGQDHLAVQRMRKRMEDLRSAIDDEQKRITSTLDSEYQLARAKHDELAATMTEVAGEEGNNSTIFAKIRDLESAAESLRLLYNTILQRFSEVNKNTLSEVQEARIISNARPPMKKESSKKRLALMGGTVSFGLLLGLGLAFWRESPVGVFRTPEQLTRSTGFYCALLPKITQSGAWRGAVASDYVLDAPFSRFSESLRNIWAELSIASRERNDKVIAIVSSVPKEGKTTVASNLASLLAAVSKDKGVLLIDGDLHKTSLSERVAPMAKVGLLEAMKDPENIKSYVTHLDRSGLDVLPCVITQRAAHAADILGSSEMERLLESARKTYDLVIIEIAPIVSVIDFKLVERFIDRFILVVEWGVTKERLVLEALSESHRIRDRILCVVLNKADPRALKSIEHYKGTNYGSYYQT